MAYSCRLVVVCIVFSLFLLPSSFSQETRERDPTQEGSQDCYDSQGRPQRCYPPFQNAAQVGANISATNTCGSREQQFCRITSAVSGTQDQPTEQCEAVGDASNDRLTHPARNMIDQQRSGEVTWWQSDTMQDLGWRDTHSINVTISLGKAYDVTFVQVTFHSLRPHSWTLHKSHDFGATWSTYQYYSLSCLDDYNMTDSRRLLAESLLLIGDDQRVCTSGFSDFVPISGGVVVYGTLEHKLNRERFVENPVLREWVTATDIRLEFNRMRTFGDEIFGDWKKHQCYYYAVESVSIGARCQCNGHASECVGSGQARHCVCQHNTTGRDCEMCADFYVDKPWEPATYTNPFVCQECQCNGHTRECRFNTTLYRLSGNVTGGECLNCQDNTIGTHCERCTLGYYRDRDEPPTEDNPCKGMMNDSGICENLKMRLNSRERLHGYSAMRRVGQAEQLI